MNTSISAVRAVTFLLLCIGAFTFVISPAFADHGDKAEVVSHATTAHDEEAEVKVTVISAPVVNVSEVARMEALLSALQQLVELLKQKADLEHAQTPHEHEEEHDEAEDNDEDHA